MVLGRLHSTADRCGSLTIGEQVFALSQSTSLATELARHCSQPRGNELRLHIDSVLVSTRILSNSHANVLLGPGEYGLAIGGVGPWANHDSDKPFCGKDLQCFLSYTLALKPEDIPQHVSLTGFW